MLLEQTRLRNGDNNKQLHLLEAASRNAKVARVAEALLQKNAVKGV